MIKKRIIEKVDEIVVKEICGFSLLNLSLNFESCNLGDKGVDMISKHIGMIDGLNQLSVVLDKN